METIKPKRGRTKLPDNQRKKLVSAYLTDEEKNLILAEFGSLTNAVRDILIPLILKKRIIGYYSTDRD
jgi:hypothetical protein